MQLAQWTLDYSNKQILSYNSPELSLNLFLECRERVEAVITQQSQTHIFLFVPDPGAE